ncbi:MAG: hypothetical protein K8U03_00850 [Planctomycetia bacterium]|nr:hypothetical protein [Planctomycetia bacterium]
MKFWRITFGISFVFLSAAPLRSAAPSNSADGKTNAEVAGARTTLIVVRGADGEERYGKIFAEETAIWRKTAAASDVRFTLIGEEEAEADKEAAASSSDKERLLAQLQTETTAASQTVPLWLIFIGHGTFDGRTAAFNLRGSDVSSVELSEWLKECRRPMVVVNTTAASAPFLTALSAPGRVVVTATKSGQERNYARFGRYFAKRVTDLGADLDKDERTSLFEAYLAAARDTADFYKSDGRVATEHPLLDDDGDGKGVRADFFERDKLVKRSLGEKAVDGDAARRFYLAPSPADAQLTPAQLAERDSLEAALAALRGRKQQLAESDYFAELERLLLKLARLQVEPTK